MAQVVDVHYRGWLIRCAPERVAGGWTAVVQVWRMGPDWRELAKAIPLTTLFDDGAAAWVHGIEAGKTWVDSLSGR